jgi:hypothetical protein
MNNIRGTITLSSTANLLLPGGRFPFVSVSHIGGFFDGEEDRSLG